MKRATCKVVAVLRHAAACVAIACCTAGVSAQNAELPASLRGAAGGAGAGTVETSRESLPLGASARSARSEGDPEKTAAVDSGGAYLQTIIALAAVLALIGVVAMIVKFAAKRSGGLMSVLAPTVKAPQGVLEVLARYPVATGTQLLVLKFDRRMLLVSQSSNKGWRSGATLQTLCELADPADVASILIKTRGDEQASLAAKFQKMLASEDAEFDETEATNPYAMRSRSSEPRGKPRLDIVAGDDAATGRQTAAAIRERLAAMQNKPRKSGGAA